MKKNNVLRIVAIIILSLMFVFDILGILFIVRSCDDIKTAKADTIISTYDSSSYHFTPCYIYDYPDDTSESYTTYEDWLCESNYGFLNSSFSLTSRNSSVFPNFFVDCGINSQMVLQNKYHNVSVNHSFNFTFSLEDSLAKVSGFDSPVIFNTSQGSTNFTMPYNDGDMRINVVVSYDYDLYFNTSDIILMKETISPVWAPKSYSNDTDYDIVTWKYGIISHNVEFYDSDNRTFRFHVIERNFYNLSGSNEIITLKNIVLSGTYSNIFDQGYNSGFIDGNKDKLTYGNIQYNNGYNKGNADAKEVGEISFFNLIASVVDVPVKAFTSLFNINIFEVNLTAFFVSILSLILVFKIIGIILGKL